MPDQGALSSSTPRGASLPPSQHHRNALPLSFLWHSARSISRKQLASPLEKPSQAMGRPRRRCRASGQGDELRSGEVGGVQVVVGVGEDGDGSLLPASLPPPHWVGAPHHSSEAAAWVSFGQGSVGHHGKTMKGFSGSEAHTMADCDGIGQSNACP
ncbi:hypothetical protein BRADI_2g23138v3 [Brachypodium distachyon]|uniref:Uncharacterized protein n=1 Tax=Brachypodium distachyon TaxID=15368 RepID=A0A0Q3G3K2_BRADI|nr:hypothetical protein BRADI_2g23138v3 [Brachypodium distachyon]PNT71101.1 hypothetical protein BRADI_2g23138v3 [Brachypodium distachyon]PNT71102.1 hypothetical protein BRADI_2g23138v3 [Brachypodium distachyon]